MCNASIVVQFGLSVIQLEFVHSDVQCRRSQYGAQDDKWIGCNSWSYLGTVSLSQVDLGINLGHFFLSALLLFDVIADGYMQGRRFFTTSSGAISWLNIVDASLQIAVFFYDIVQLSVSDHSVTGRVYLSFCVLRLLRVYKVLSLSRTITAAFTLFGNLYPIVKAFFLIVYSFFFFFGILGVVLFSYASTSDGIAYYPNQSQYISFYQPRDASDYPNSYGPGNFGCSALDVFGSPGLCGQAGAQPRTPHWNISDTSDAGMAALGAAFVIGNGIDSRVGGCFNSVGEAENRVLPCYCYYTVEKMNRTTSCDWLNPQWYKTEIAQVDQMLCVVCRSLNMRSTLSFFFRVITGFSVSTTSSLPWYFSREFALMSSAED
jgi:hypothetical protein